MVEAAIWKACAGSLVHIPGAGSRVYYFPEGHIDHSSHPLPPISHLPLRPFFVCRVVHVARLLDHDSDEVYARIRLEPETPAALLDQVPHPPADVTDDVVVSFAKILTPSDANNGGGFSVPRFCADSIFPPLDYAADPPVQTLSITDLQGQTWNFRHIYRGTPRRHLLTTGWSKFVNSKRLIGGDSVVFIKNKNTGKLFVGVRRRSANRNSNANSEYTRWASMYARASSTGSANAGNKGKVSSDSVVDVLMRVANNMPFEVVYYPKPGGVTQDFVLAAEKVDGAMGAVYWSGGMRVKMRVETEDSSRLSWFEGTVSSVVVQDSGMWEGSPWRMLQVAWDEPEAMENMKKVSPWQVEFIPPTLPIDAAFPPAKKLRIPENCGFLTGVREADYPLPPPPHMGFSNSMMAHLNSSSYLNYSIFPAGMQGARQDTSRVITTDSHQSLPIGHADSNLHEKTVDVSTNLNIGSSKSDVVSPDSSSSILSPRTINISGLISRTSAPRVSSSSIQLFGQTIQTDCPVESPKHLGSGGECVANQESEALLAIPCSKTVPTVDVVETCSLSMEK